MRLSTPVFFKFADARYTFLDTPVGRAKQLPIGLAHVAKRVRSATENDFVSERRRVRGEHDVRVARSSHVELQQDAVVGCCSVRRVYRSDVVPVGVFIADRVEDRAFFALKKRVINYGGTNEWSRR